MLSRRYTPGVSLEEQGFLATQHNQEFGLVAQLASRYDIFPEGEGAAIASGGGGVPCRIYDSSPGGGVSGLTYKPTQTVRVMLETWDAEAGEWTVDTSRVINAYPLSDSPFSVVPTADGAGGGLAGEPAGLVMSWTKGIVYDPDAAAWEVGGWCEADSEVEVWLDAGTPVAATVSPDGTWTATLDLSAATRGVHSISAAEKFFGDSTWQATRTHAVWRENAEATPSLRKAVAPRPIDDRTPDVQDAYDLGASNNDNRTSHLAPMIDCAINDPGPYTTHYGRIYLSKDGATVYHDEQDNSGGAATAEGDVFAFGVGSAGSAAEADLVDGDIYRVQVDFWGVGGVSLGVTTDDVHSGMSRPMLLRIDAEETGEGSPTRYNLRGVLLQTGESYHVQLPFRCLKPNTAEENTALDA